MAHGLLRLLVGEKDPVLVEHGRDAEKFTQVDIALLEAEDRLRLPVGTGRRDQGENKAKA